MTIHNFRVCAGELTSKFDGKTVSEICIQICTRILEFYADRYYRGSMEATAIHRHLSTIQTRLSILGRLVSQGFETSPTVEVMCVFVLTDSFSGNPLRRVSFDLTRARLGLVSADTVLLFLSTLLREGVEDLRQRLEDIPRLRALANECAYIFEEIMIEIRSYIQVSPFVGNEILESRTIFLRLEVTRPPLIRV